MLMLITLSLTLQAKTFTLQEYGQMLQTVEVIAKQSLQTKNYTLLFQELNHLPPKITLTYTYNNKEISKSIYLDWLKNYLQEYVIVQNENGKTTTQITENTEEQIEDFWKAEKKIVPITDKIKKLIITLENIREELTLIGYKSQNEETIKNNFDSLNNSNLETNNTEKKKKNWLQSIFEQITEWIDKNLKGIRKVWNLFLLALILAALIFLILQAKKYIRNTEKFVQETTHGGLLQPDDPRSSAELAQKAKEHEKQGNFRMAIRYYYVAFIVQLEEQKIISYQPHFTNWEYQRKLNAMGYHQSEILELTTVFDKVWYGMYPIHIEQYQTYVLAYEKTKSILAATKA